MNVGIDKARNDKMLKRPDSLLDTNDSSLFNKDFTGVNLPKVYVHDIPGHAGHSARTLSKPDWPCDP